MAKEYSARQYVPAFLVVLFVTSMSLVVACAATSKPDSSVTMLPVRDKAEAWLEVLSPNFVVLTDRGEKQARHIADQFERIRSVFHALFPQMQIDPSSPIIVMAVEGEKDFRALEPEDYLGRGKLELAGFFMRTPDKNYVLLRLDAGGEHPYATVYHEYTHLVWRSKAEEWPLWLHEGLAEFYQNTDIRGKEVVVGEPSAESLALLRQNRLLPLATLFTVDRTSPYYNEQNKGSMFYAESWALTHYLGVKDYEQNTHMLRDYEDLVSLKVDAVTAGARAFGNLNQLQAALEKYVAQGSFVAFKRSGSTEVDDAAFKVQSLSPAQADAIRADFLAYNNRFGDARHLLEEVLREQPNNVSAHETMGYLELRQRHLDEARKWYEQAVKLDSQSYLAHYYFASISMDSGPLTSDSDELVENSFRTAIKLNPSFTPPYDRLAVFYGMRRRNLDEAHALANTAVQLDPANLGYRLNAANVLLTMQRCKDSIAVTQNAMKFAKSPEEIASVNNSLQAAQRCETSVSAQAYYGPYHDAQNLLKGKLDDDSAAKAESSLRAALDANPDFAPAYDGLAYLRVLRNQKLDEAEKLALHAQQLEPGNIYYRLREVQVLERLGRAQDAVNVATRVLSMTKTTPEHAEALTVLTKCEQILAYQKYEDFRKARVSARPSRNETARINTGRQTQTAVIPPSARSTSMPQMSPSFAKVVIGTTQQFSSTVEAPAEKGVIWRVFGAGCKGAACGTISPAGLYTAPLSLPSPPIVTVTAASAADPSKNAFGMVTIVSSH
jgi:tetratricopeptide (TPR) repeat protein